MKFVKVHMTKRKKSGTLAGLLVCGAPGMGDNLAVKVRYRLGSRNC